MEDYNPAAIMREMKMRKEYETELAALQAECDTEAENAAKWKKRFRIAVLAAAVFFLLATVLNTLYFRNRKELSNLKAEYAAVETGHAED